MLIFLIRLFRLFLFLFYLISLSFFTYETHCLFNIYMNTHYNYVHTLLLYTTNVHAQALFRQLSPLGDRVLVQRAKKEVQTASGIFLPSDKTKDPNEGTVVAVGPGERDVTGALHPTLLQKDDVVLLPEYGGMKVTLDNQEYFLFRESDILGKFE
jgi:chaperonin GroES